MVRKSTVPVTQRTPGRKSIKPQQERSTATREKLIKAAIKVLAKHGYADFTTSAVADQAKVSRGALQYHFETRDDILIAARNSVGADLDLKWSNEELLELSIPERIRLVVGHYWKVISSPRYIAAIEVRLYERFNPVMHKTLVSKMNWHTEQRNNTWALIFSDSGLPREQLISYRLFVLDTLRGLALRRIEQGPKHDVSPQLEILTSLLIDRLDQGSSASAEAQS
ncbi:TetR/AcrR family transcriptional regulator [Marinobacter sp. F3R11]|uniref:TetR/AcrR family transcriptional regulator n=1 Tax=Marinobacter sp. F3R11 TaxID=2267231 RepID=UPI000DE97638|nr:TetR/AcrR family transcriptional regulator [Marinobacter sp. F3R11]RBW51211.1 hypothetical protein DS878_03625 [Marinobacter sp. F3R11]